ncbi:MAG: carboxypeptidase-like regulatory domain-containing protein, partial [Kofleriaceae bacterium]
MPIPATPLRRNDRGPAVAALHRTFEILNRKIDQRERDTRVYGAATEALVREYQTQSGAPVTGVFDEPTHDRIAAQLSDIGPFSVYGQVLDANGDPVIGASVFAVDVDLRRNEVLGQATTDSGGDYEVRYPASKFTRAEKASADLVVRALLGDRRVAESTTRFNAPPEVRIDLGSAERHGDSEYTRLRSEVEPLLDGAAPSELVDTDVDFLAGETGRDAERWRSFVRAQQLSALELARKLKLPAEAFYAWLRARLPADWDALVQVRSHELRSTLIDAVANNVVPAWTAEEIDQLIARIPNADARAANDLLGAAVAPETAGKLAGRIDAVETVSDALLDQLVETEVIAPAEADRVGLAVSLHRLAGSDPAVVAALLGTKFPALEQGTLQHARELALLEPSELERALDEANAPRLDGIDRPTQARGLAIQIAATYPEDAFRIWARRELGDTHAAVLDRNPDVPFVELDYLPGSVGLAQVDFGELDAAARKQVVSDLHAQQRIHSVTGNAITASELRKAGVSSASQIAKGSAAELAA